MSLLDEILARDHVKYCFPAKVSTKISTLWLSDILYQLA
jgi:hypothetical protein